MEIIKKKNDSAFEIALEGRLDTTTAPQLEEIVKGELEGVKELCFDCAGLEYISSAGLRVFLAAQKKMMATGGAMTVKNVNEIVKEVFDVTGFSDVLTII